MTKGLGTVMKRTHLEVTAVSEEVTYPLIVEQRTLTICPTFVFFSSDHMIGSLCLAINLLQSVWRACVNIENRCQPWCRFTQERAYCTTQNKLCSNGNRLSPFAF